MCQLHLANNIPKILLAKCNDDKREDNSETEPETFDLSQADLDDHDSGLTYAKVVYI